MVFFIWCAIGEGIENTFIENNDEFSIFNIILMKEIYIPFWFFYN